jgi:tetrahydromethanopterin S-methyltransferase subunit G
MADDLTESRFQLHEERLDHYSERLEAVEADLCDRAEAKESRHGRAVNFAMLGLFAVEIIIGLIEIWMMHHV